MYVPGSASLYAWTANRKHPQTSSPSSSKESECNRRKFNSTRDRLNKVDRTLLAPQTLNVHGKKMLALRKILNKPKVSGFQLTVVHVQLYYYMLLKPAKIIISLRQSQMSVFSCPFLCSWKMAICMHCSTTVTKLWTVKWRNSTTSCEPTPTTWTEGMPACVCVCVQLCMHRRNESSTADMDYLRTLTTKLPLSWILLMVDRHNKLWISSVRQLCLYVPVCSPCMLYAHCAQFQANSIPFADVFSTYWSPWICREEHWHATHTD